MGRHTLYMWKRNINNKGVLRDFNSVWSTDHNLELVVGVGGALQTFPQLRKHGLSFQKTRREQSFIFD